MHYLVVGLSHKTAPVAIRERLAIPSSKIGESLRRLLSQDVQEGMILSTCNRVEACLVSPSIERGVNAMHDLLWETGQMKREELEPYLYIKPDKEAIQHLFRVTSSLDSMVIGEPQIGGQVKTAYAQALEHKTTGRFLNRLVPRALHVAKKVRRETALGRYPVSVSYTAVVLASKIFDHLQEKTVLILGAGEMSELAALHFKKRGTKILIANRTRERAVSLAEKLNGEVIGLDQVSARLVEADILLTSVQTERYLIGVEEMKRVIAERKGRSVFLIDLGVPRNIDPEVNRVENVYLYNIDDLQGIVTANQREREEEAKKADRMIEEEVVLFQQALRSAELIRKFFGPGA